MTFTITWLAFKWFGVVLFILSCIAFLAGTLPDRAGYDAGNALRWVAWPLMMIWVLTIFIAGLLS